MLKEAIMNQQQATEKLVTAYNTMLKRIKETWQEAEPTLNANLEKAKEKATELGELTREEAEKVGAYLKKDMEEAGAYLAENGRQLKDWLGFELEFAEAKMVELFASVADKTRIELERFAQRARAVGEWHTGEITGIGVLRCNGCGELLHFEKTGHIPPCPKCHGTVFRKDFSVN